MDDLSFRELLLKMSFSIMACDGDIDPQEIGLIRELDSKENLFQIEDLDESLNSMLTEINERGLGFLRSFISELESVELTHKQKLKLVEVAIKMIEADKEVLYSEIKFFKVVHSQIDLADEEILSNFSHVNDIEFYIGQDLKTDNYIEKISADYFNNHELPKFSAISEIENMAKKKS
jgi:uncharacterized tellurite resistance protein B-like protein